MFMTNSQHFFSISRLTGPAFLNKTIIILFLILFVSVESSFACYENSNKMIDILAGGLSQSNSPTIENAGSISKVVLACPDSRLRLKAVQRFSKSISNYNEPSISVAKLMIKICGKDENCALQAIKAISIGISHYNEPTVSLAWVISEITKGAPTDRVKDLAMNTLSKCITSHTDPTRTCSAKLIEIGNLRQLELPVEPKVMPVETPLESPEKNSPAESKKIPSPEKLPYDD